MKKTLIVGAILSSLVFAKGYNNTNNNTTKGNGIGGQGNMVAPQNSTLTDTQQKELATLRETHFKATAPLRISVEEKNLAIEKELLADKPNWTRIEAIEKEKAAVESQIEVLMLKNRVEIKEKFGVEFGFGMGQGMEDHMGTGMGGRGFNN